MSWYIFYTVDTKQTTKQASHTEAGEPHQVQQRPAALSILTNKEVFNTALR